LLILTLVILSTSLFSQEKDKKDKWNVSDPYSKIGRSMKFP